MDIESEILNSNIHWQDDIFKQIDHGFKVGEMFTMTAARGTGKSAFSSAEFQKLWKDVFAEKPLTDLILGESTTYGSRYYTVEPVGGKWSDMSAWCRSTFGDPADVWDNHKFMWPEAGRWYENNRKFWFRNLKDRDWFVMRWRS